MVVLQPGYDVRGLLHNDRFLVMCLPVKNADITAQDLHTLWKVNYLLFFTLNIHISTPFF